MLFQIFKDRLGEWRWYLRAANGLIIATSAESYRNKADCLATIDLIKGSLVIPIKLYSCFISYSSRDQTFAEQLYADLEGKGVACWFAPEDLGIGDKTRVKIDKSIRKHDKLLLILSKHAIASDWVEKEVETAMEQERQQKKSILFPIRLDDDVMVVESGWAADIRRSRNIGDFRGWESPDIYQKALDR